MLIKPNSQKSKILFDLIRKVRGVTEEDFNYHNFRGFISEFRKHINMKHIDKKFTNSFGRKGYYRVHFITNSERRNAVKYYKSLFKKVC